MSLTFAPTEKGCPVLQMDFLDIKRYLQKGFETPVQSSLAAHIENCSACKDTLEQAVSLSQAGKQLFHEKLPASLFVEETFTGNHLEDTQMAAFIDGSLAADEQEQVKQHLGECLSCFQHYFHVKNMVEPGHLVTPVLIKDKIKVRNEIPVTGIFDPFVNRIRKMVDTLGSSNRKFWLVPATAFALGILLMLFLNPVLKRNPEYIILLPGLEHVNEYDVNHVLSGLPDEAGNLLSSQQLVVIPAESANKVTFTWPVVENAREYQIQVVNAAGQLLVEKKSVISNQIILPLEKLISEKYCLFFVKAVTQENLVRPVTQLRFQVQP